MFYYLFQSLGNHEFDNGVNGLTPFIENLTSPVLAANLVLNREPSLQAERNLMKSIVFIINGTQVGVIGYLTPETKFLAVKNNVDYTEEVAAIQEEVAKLKMKGVKIFIALGHSGFLKDLEIAKEVEDLDLVIGGHTNTFLWNGTSPDSEKSQGPYPTIVKQKSGRGVLVVQAYAYTKYLGKLNLFFNSEGEIVSYDGNPVLLDNSIPQDPEVLDIVLKYRGDINAISDVVVGNTSIILDGDSCRLTECNMGNLISDAMVYKYASAYIGEGWTDAPIAFKQGGGIRASIAHLNFQAITKGDLLTVMPFDGNMVKMTVEGKILLKMLEHSVAAYDPIQTPGQFLQMSGVKVEYDLKKAPGKRVVRALARCGKCDIPSFSLVNETVQYNILVPSFLSVGGDGFSMLEGIPSLALNYDELTCTTLYVQNHSPVLVGVEGRIIMKNNRVGTQSAASYSTPKLMLIIPTMVAVQLLTIYY